VLVFTRKREEAIVIGDGVEVRVLRVGRTSVKLGVTASRHVPVHRREIYDEIRRANVTAASDPRTAAELAIKLRQLAARRPSSPDSST
jgi:carbon storage regulator